MNNVMNNVMKTSLKVLSALLFVLLIFCILWSRTTKLIAFQVVGATVTNGTPTKACTPASLKLSTSVLSQLQAQAAANVKYPHRAKVLMSVEKDETVLTCSIYLFTDGAGIKGGWQLVGQNKQSSCRQAYNDMLIKECKGGH